MALQVINVGSAPNDGLGDPIRTSFIKCNDNFGELYSRAQTVPPVTLVGSPGDVAGMYAYDENFWYYCYANYDGSSTIWAQVAQVGNIVVSGIQSGTSDAQFDDIDGNLVITINSVPDIAIFRNDGMYAGNIFIDIVTANSITGDILTPAQPYITSVGNLTGLTLTGVLSSNSNVSTTGNVIAANVVSTGLITTTANVSAANVNGTNIAATSAITTPGTISATGNITTAGYFVGTFFGNITGNFVVPGANTEVLFNTAGNADSNANFTFNKATSVLQVTGNVSTGNVIATTVSAAGAVSAVGNVRGGNINTAGQVSATANVTGGNVLTGGQVSATGNVSGGNIRTTGQVSATGNITGGNISVGSINASGAVSVSGNVTGGNLIGGAVSAVSNVVSVNVNASANISAAGNITASYFLGNGSLLSGIITSVSNINNGTSTVEIAAANANVTTSVNGTSNVIVVASSGQYVTGVASVSGNVTGGNLLASGSGQISTNGNVTGGNVLTASVTTNIGNGGSALVNGGGNGIGNIGESSGYFGNAFVTTVTASSTVSATGNVAGGNITTAGLISATGNITGGNLTVGTGTVTLGGIVNANANGVGNIGSASLYFNTVFAAATSALYADLAENYLADAWYTAGTVVVFGGDKEITISKHIGDSAVAGVISANPAYKMNSGLEGEHVATLALIGRVPCYVTGPIKKGQLLVSAPDGRAQACAAPQVGTVVGKALEDFEGGLGTIEIAVGKL